MAAACIITAFEGLVRPMGKWRGLTGLILSGLFCYNLDTKLSYMTVYTLASTFGGLTLSVLVEQLFAGTTLRFSRGLPNRVDRR